MQRQLSDDLDFINRVTGVIARTQKLPPESVTVDKSFEELKIDSLDGINILFALEGEFNVDIPDDAARAIKTIREMVAGVATLVEAKAAQESPVQGREVHNPPSETTQAPAAPSADPSA